MEFQSPRNALTLTAENTAAGELIAENGRLQHLVADLVVKN